MTTRSTWEWEGLGAFIVLIVVGAITIEATVGWSQNGAAWVQAVGSIGAICAAIWISTKADREREARSKEAIFRFENRLENALNNAVKAAECQNRADLNACLATIDELLQVFAPLPLDSIPEHMIDRYLQLRLVAADSVEDPTRLVPDLVNWGHVENRLRVRRGAVKEMREHWSKLQS